MGHLIAKQYRQLREKLDRFPIGAPERSSIYEILQTVYTHEEAELAAQLPFKFASLGAISRKVGIPEEQLKAKLDAMADKGLVYDLPMGGKTHYMLTPTLVGFFEFSMMRVRKDIDQKKLAGLYHKFLLEEDGLIKTFSPNIRTMPLRTLVHETTLPENYSEILDWEKASYVVGQAGKWSVGLCYCRHVNHHLDQDCKKFRLESCMSLGFGADYLIRHGLAKEISKQEALELLAETQEAGLVHMADNIKHKPFYMCNCCGCCCEILQGFKKFRPPDNIFSSNFQAEVDPTKCTGCKKCQKACPVDAIEMVDNQPGVHNPKFKLHAAPAPDACLGCGVCHPQCKFGAIQMAPRPQRRVTPDSTMARLLIMALEQDRLQEFMVDKDDGIVAYAANTVIGTILKLPPAKQLLARDKIKSRFIGYVLNQAKKAGIKGSDF